MAYKAIVHVDIRALARSSVVIDGGSPGSFKDGVSVVEIRDEKGNLYPFFKPKNIGKDQFLLVLYQANRPHGLDEVPVTGELSITLSTSTDPVVVPVVYVDSPP